MTAIPHLQPVVPGLDILVGESEGRFPRSHCFVIRGDTDVLVDASPIYGGHPWAGLPLRYWEGQMILKHLERLEERGRIRRMSPDDHGLRITAPSDVGCRTAGMATPKLGPQVHWSRR